MAKKKTNLSAGESGSQSRQSQCEVMYSERFSRLSHPLRILLIKPFQPINALLHTPPLGLLYLISSLRERFGDAVNTELVDMKLRGLDASWLSAQLKSGELGADIVGVSALNFEAQSVRDIARACKQYSPEIITAIGGPYALRSAEELLRETAYDWVFSGAGDSTFTEAVGRLLAGQGLDGIPGMSYKRTGGYFHIDAGISNVDNLDALPMPAWDAPDLDAYAKKSNMMGMLKGRKYAPIITSRGCPYKCSYCHDIFGKKFNRRSSENVIEEIAMLYETYGVDEFQIVDDVFNLDRPRLQAIMKEISRRWPGRLKFCFPNGLRADILDDESIDALKSAGTYALKIAVETVTPRLQKMIGKNLDIQKARRAIDACDRRGIITGGFFMFGFPTETIEEIRATIDFAIKSRLAVAHFFIAVPQKHTLLYDQAKEENAGALDEFMREAESGGSTTYYTDRSWYQRAYGVPLNRYLTWAIFRFYFSPARVLRILRHVPLRSILDSALKLAGIVLRLHGK